jgi:hypothetical protein
MRRVLLFRWKPLVKEKEDIRVESRLEQINNSEAADRLRHAINEFVRIICEDKNPSEVEAAAYALASVVGFLVGFASAKANQPFERFHAWCREGFEKSARGAYDSHVG